MAIAPAYVMTHDNTAAVMPKFRGLGAARISNPAQVVFTLDHNVQDKSEGNLAKYASIKNFAAEQGVDFYPAGRGIGHQIMCEEVSFKAHLFSAKKKSSGHEEFIRSPEQSEKGIISSKMLMTLKSEVSTSRRSCRSAVCESHVCCVSYLHDRFNFQSM